MTRRASRVAVAANVCSRADNGRCAATAARPDPLSGSLERPGGLAADHRVGVAVMATIVPHSEPVDDEARPTSVYRYYDHLGVLIYVGVTSRATRRQHEHSDTKEWWPFVVRQEVDHYPTRAEALERERTLIKSNRPPFNRQHNPGWESTRAAYFRLRACQSTFDVSDNAYEAYCKVKGVGIPLILAGLDPDERIASFISDPVHPQLLAAFCRVARNIVFYSLDGQRLGGATEVRVHGSVFLIDIALRTTAPHEFGGVVALVKLSTGSKPAQFRITTLREISAPAVGAVGA